MKEEFIVKPIKHMRSKRGFYIGRLRQVENHANHSKLSSEMIGTPGRGMAWTWHQLMTLASEHHKGAKVIDPKSNFHEKIKNGNRFS